MFTLKLPIFSVSSYQHWWPALNDRSDPINRKCHVIFETRVLRTALYTACYHAIVFNFGRPQTPGDWIVHIAGAIVAIFLVWWMLRVYVL
ncbi:MAG: hypothetical protein WBV36_14665 [Terriglobales bacterium]